MSHHEPDVLVVGGGAAGIGAAVGAAQRGARVVLVERAGFLGGLATQALVGTVCGLFTRREGALGDWAMQGFPRRFAEQLAAAGGTAPLSWRHGLGFLPYEPFAFRTVADAVLHEAGVEVVLHASVHAAQREGDRVVQVEARALGHTLRWRPAAVVDTTGVAELTALADGAVDVDADYQAAALVACVAGLAPIDDTALRIGLHTAMRRAVDGGQLPAAALALSVVPGTLRPGRVYLKLGLPGRFGGAPHEASLVERRARQVLGEVLAHLRATEAVFAAASLADVAAQVGFRTGRRARGREILSEAHLFGQEPVHHGVAAGCWPVEIWGEAPQPELELLPEGATYGIPAGALQSQDLGNVWIAGRNLSATPRAVASARVIGTCLGTGYAAGSLAAGWVAGRALHHDVARLRRELLDQGE